MQVATAQNPSWAAVPRKFSDKRVNWIITKSSLTLAINFGLAMNDLTQCQGPCYSLHCKAAQFRNDLGQLQSTPKVSTDPIQQAPGIMSPTISTITYTPGARVLTSNYDDTVRQDHPKTASCSNSSSMDEGSTHARPGAKQVAPSENMTFDSQAKEQHSPSAGRMAESPDMNKAGHQCLNDCTLTLKLGRPKAEQTSAQRFPEARQQANAS